MVKVFTKNKQGKIEFTEAELKKLLDEVYWDGYHDGSKTTYVYTEPYSINNWWWKDPYYYTYCKNSPYSTSISSDTSTNATITATMTNCNESTPTISLDSAQSYSYSTPEK